MFQNCKLLSHIKERRKKGMFFLLFLLCRWILVGSSEYHRGGETVSPALRVRYTVSDHELTNHGFPASLRRNKQELPTEILTR